MFGTLTSVMSESCWKDVYGRDDWKLPRRFHQTIVFVSDVKILTQAVFWLVIRKTKKGMFIVILLCCHVNGFKFCLLLASSHRKTIARIIRNIIKVSCKN